MTKTQVPQMHSEYQAIKKKQAIPFSGNSLL